LTVDVTPTLTAVEVNAAVPPMSCWRPTGGATTFADESCPCGLTFCDSRPNSFLSMLRRGPDAIHFQRLGGADVESASSSDEESTRVA